MDALLGFLVLALVVLIVVGAIKPHLVLPKALAPTRGKAIAIYLGILFVIGFVISSMEAERMKDPAYAAAKKRTAEEAARRKAATEREEARRKRLQEWESSGGKISALVMSQKFVARRLKAPATADFASITESKVTHLGEGEFLVVSYVDAQNSFGAKLRNHYACRLKDAGNDNWQLIDLRME